MKSLSWKFELNRARNRFFKIKQSLGKNIWMHCRIARTLIRDKHSRFERHKRTQFLLTIGQERWSMFGDIRIISFEGLPLRQKSQNESSWLSFTQSAFSRHCLLYRWCYPLLCMVNTENYRKEKRNFAWDCSAGRVTAPWHNIKAL